MKSCFIGCCGGHELTILFLLFFSDNGSQRSIHGGTISGLAGGEAETDTISMSSRQDPGTRCEIDTFVKMIFVKNYDNAMASSCDKCLFLKALPQFFSVQNWAISKMSKICDH